MGKSYIIHELQKCDGDFGFLKSQITFVFNSISRNEYYGGLWASFNLDNLDKWVKDCENSDSVNSGPDDPNFDVKINNGEEFLCLRNQASHISNLELKWHIPK